MRTQPLPRPTTSSAPPRRWRRRARRSAARSRSSSPRSARRSFSPFAFVKMPGSHRTFFVLFLRHHRRMPEALLDLLRRRREFHRRAAPLALAGHHEAVGAGDDVAAAQGRVLLDADLREAQRILAVAGAALDDFVAVAEGVGQLGIRLAVLGGGIVYVAAVDDLGFGRRTQAVAGLRLALAVRARDREMPAVAGTHAEGLPAAIARPRRGLLESVGERHL